MKTYDTTIALRAWDTPIGRIPAILPGKLVIGYDPRAADTPALPSAEDGLRVLDRLSFLADPE